MVKQDAVGYEMLWDKRAMANKLHRTLLRRGAHKPRLVAWTLVAPWGRWHKALELSRLSVLEFGDALIEVGYEVGQ